MDPSKLPLFPACGAWDGGAAASDACGAAMAPVCAGATANATDGVAESLLLDAGSNCSNWMTTIQTLQAVAGPQGGSPHLDAAMQTYCGGLGSLTRECACLAFPIAAQAWCAAGSVSCPGAAARDCVAQEFAQTVQDSQEEVVLQFSGCNPYYCWNAPCFQTPQTQLLTSNILASQSTGHCAGICVQDIGATSANIAPMAPGSFSPASIVANVDNLASCGANTKPALLVAPPQTWHWASNGIMQVPLYIANDGDVVAQVSVASASMPGVCALEPTSNGGVPIFGRSVQQFAVVCNQTSLSAWYAASASYDPQADPHGPPSFTVDAMFKLSYKDLSSGSDVTTAPLGITAVILPAAAPIVVTQTVVPWWFWAALAAILVCVCVQMVALTTSKRAVVRLLAEQGVAV